MGLSASGPHRQGGRGRIPEQRKDLPRGGRGRRSGDGARTGGDGAWSDGDGGPGPVARGRTGWRREVRWKLGRWRAMRGRSGRWLRCAGRRRRPRWRSRCRCGVVRAELVSGRRTSPRSGGTPGGDMSEPKRGTVFDRADLTAHKRVLGVLMGIQALFSI
jgi:hypothetical protein